MTEHASALGAYGLRLTDLPGGRWLREVPAHWPRWEINQQQIAVDLEGTFSSRRAIFPQGAGVYSRIDRAAATTTFISPFVLPSDAFVHPLLVPTAVVCADWCSRLSFHAGAFVAGGGVWVLLGQREHGKSSTLAWLAAHGIPIVCDDIVVTDGMLAFAGPRCIDLRAGAAERFGVGTPLGRVGMRERWRVDLGPAPAESLLRGFLVLEWGDETTCEASSRQDAFRRLTDHHALKLSQQHPHAWLGVVGKPMYVLRRPRSWDSLDAAMHLALSLLADASADALNDERIANPT